MLKIGIVSACALLALTGFCLAQEEADASHMSCQATAGLVTQRGAVVLSTGAHTFDRIVRDQGFCSRSETTAPMWVPTADNPQCFAGYRCKDKFNEGSGRDQ